MKFEEILTFILIYFFHHFDRKCCIHAINISLISILVAKAQINGSTEGSVYIHYNFIDFEYRYGLCQVWKNKQNKIESLFFNFCNVLYTY